MSIFSSDVLERAQSSRLLISIPFHYRPSRMIFLMESIRTLSDFPVRTLTTMIITNTADRDELATLRSLLQPYNTEGKSFLVSSATELSEPHALCWAHRSVVTDLFCVQQCEYTHFIYIEDDLRFSYQNFCYFLHGREHLRSSRLIPSFVRIELNAARSKFYSTDQWELMDFDKRPHIDNGRSVFVPIDSVYTATYVLDHELAFEFVNSRSFDLERSKEVSHWGITERAALGLSVENAPEHYYSRYVVAVDKTTRTPIVSSWIYHLPNNYTNNESSEFPYGKIPIGALYKA